MRPLRLHAIALVNAMSWQLARGGILFLSATEVVILGVIYVFSPILYILPDHGANGRDTGVSKKNSAFQDFVIFM